MVVSLLLCFASAPSLAESDIVSVGKTGNRYVYKVRGLFVVASVGNLIGGCVVRSSGALDCQSGASASLSDVEGRPGAVGETLSQKNQRVQAQAQRLETQQTEIDELRTLVNNCSAQQAFPGQRPLPAQQAFPAQQTFDAAPAPLSGGDDGAPSFDDEEDDLNF